VRKNPWDMPPEKGIEKENDGQDKQALSRDSPAGLQNEENGHRTEIVVPLESHAPPESEGVDVEDRVAADGDGSRDKHHVDGAGP
jgi:hypothetical protein